jgi:hypothetical protein
MNSKELKEYIVTAIQQLEEDGELFVSKKATNAAINGAKSFLFALNVSERDSDMQALMKQAAEPLYHLAMEILRSRESSIVSED